jgi:putative spermidine/putrescine transport system permease protein
MITIVLLSFQGPDGGLTFPMNGVSSHWFSKLWNDGLPNVDIWSAFARSAWLGLVVMVLTVMLSLLAGLAYRKHFFGSDVSFLRRHCLFDHAVNRRVARYRPRIPHHR